MRTREHAWTGRPNTWLLAATAANLTVALTLALTGTLMSPLSPDVAAITLGIVCAAALLADYLKIPIFKALGCAASGVKTQANDWERGLVLPRDDHGYARCVHHIRAHRAKQHSGESTTAMASDDDKLGRLGLGEQMVDGVAEHDHTTHPDIRVAFLPPGQPLGQRFFGRGFNG